MNFLRRCSLLTLALCSSVVLVGCNWGGSAGWGPPPPTVTALKLAPASIALKVSGTQALTATGSYSDATTKDLTGTSFYFSDNVAVATVSTSGVVTAVTPGSAHITATAAGVQSGSVTVTVTAKVASIAITTPSGGALALPLGMSSALAVTATYSDGSTQADAGVTYAVTAASPAGAATLSGAQLTGALVGTASIVATDTATGLVSAPLNVTVTAATGGAFSTVTFDDPAVSYTLTGFGGAEDSTVVLDPTGGTNKVSRVNRSASAATYAGTTVSTFANQSVGTIPLDAANTRMTVRVYSPAAGIHVRLKAEDAADNTHTVETEANTTLANAWELLTFNFANPATGTAALNPAFTFNKVSIFFNFGVDGATAGAQTYYFDDLAFLPGTGGGGATTPTMAAPTPPARNASDVLSVYSDAYAQIPNVNLFPNWGQSTVVSEVQVAGNNTQKYATFNYEGIDWMATPINVSAMVSLHVDVWTPDVTTLKVSIISNGLENAVTLTPTLAGWNSYDIDLAQYTVPDKTAIIQLKFEGTPPGGTVYLDNIYFWKGAASVNSPVFMSGALDTGVAFFDFGGALNSPAPAVDPLTTFTDGTAALKFVVTGAAGQYSGGALVASAPRDLRSFNALTFWAKASQTQGTLKVQLGNDAGVRANVNFQVESIGLPLTTSWQQFVIPLPDPTQANGIDGLFSFADGNNNYTFWVAKVQYLNVPANVLGTGVVAGDGFNGVPQPQSVPVGGSYAINPAPNSVIWTLGSGMLNGSPVVPLPNGGNLNNDAWRWFKLTSNNNAVATVSVDGVINGVAAGGPVTFTGTLAGTAIPGQTAVTVTAPLAIPTTVAPTPVLAPANVISLFSSAYTNVPVDTWSTIWSSCCNMLVDPYAIGAHNVKQYTLSNFVGVEYGLNGINAAVDATAMTGFHVDIWSPNPPGNIEIQLVNDAAGAAAIGKYQTGALATGSWASLDISLASFVGLSAKNKVNQLLFVASGPTVIYIDNVYFHN